MEFGDLGPIHLAAAAVLLAFGVLLGWLAGRAGRGSEGRVAKLEDRLREAQDERTAYAEAVAKHFDRTSDLFRDLTREYTSLYAHLAEGSRDLCPDREPALGRGFEAPPLQAGPVPEQGPDADEPAGSEPEEADEIEPRPSAAVP
jgi:hypothetical protein